MLKIKPLAALLTVTLITVTWLSGSAIPSWANSVTTQPAMIKPLDHPVKRRNVVAPTVDSPAEQVFVGNAAGTVRVNNLANFEAALNIIANLGEIGGMIWGAYLFLSGVVRLADVKPQQELSEQALSEQSVAEAAPKKAVFSPRWRITNGILVFTLGLLTPATINWLVASARDSSLCN